MATSWSAAPARLALYGPPAGPTITLAYAVALGALGGIAQDVTLTVWRNPDELRAGLPQILREVPVKRATQRNNAALLGAGRDAFRLAGVATAE